MVPHVPVSGDHPVPSPCTAVPSSRATAATKANVIRPQSRLMPRPYAPSATTAAKANARRPQSRLTPRPYAHPPGPESPRYRKSSPTFPLPGSVPRISDSVLIPPLPRVHQGSPCRFPFTHSDPQELLRRTSPAPKAGLSRGRMLLVPQQLQRRTLHAPQAG